MNGSSLVLNTLVWPVANNGIRVEIDDGSLTPQALVVTIVADLAPTSVGVDLSNVTHASQPVPPAAVTPINVVVDPANQASVMTLTLSPPAPKA